MLYTDGLPAQLPWGLRANSVPGHTGQGACHWPAERGLLEARHSVSGVRSPRPHLSSLPGQSLGLLPVSKRISLQLDLYHRSPRRAEAGEGGGGEPESADIHRRGTQGQARGYPVLLSLKDA